MGFDKETVSGFVTLIDHAIAIAQDRIELRARGTKDRSVPGELERIIKGLSLKKERALNGTLPGSEGVVTLGVLRALGEWGEDPESPLAKIADDLESYYLDKMR